MSDEQRHVKREAEQLSADPPSEPATSQSTTTPRARGRGRGRGRSRGRRVVPRQAVRRKPRVSADAVLNSQTPPPAAGRGRGARGRGRGRGRSGPSYAPNTVGLGQIAPTRPTGSRAASSASGASRRSSASAAASVALSEATASTADVAFGSTLASAGSSFGGSGGGSAGGRAGRGGSASGGGRGGKAELRPVEFEEHILPLDGDPDSEDDPPNPDLALCNVDLAPWAGVLSQEGTLLPVSLPGLRGLSKEFEQKLELSIQRRDGENFAMQDRIPSFLKDEVKAEPEFMDIDKRETIVPDAKKFPVGSTARILLESGGAASLLQLPGLLPLTENPSATLDGTNEPKDEFPESSVAATAAAAERIRGLGTDLRKVGDRDSGQKLGKVRFYRSGRVVIEMEKGGTVELERGISSNKSQQLVLFDLDNKVCEEVQRSVTTRLVAVPSVAQGI